MHNLQRNPQSVEKAYEASIKGLSRKIKKDRKNSRGKFADKNEENLKKLHNDYNDKANQGCLCNLIPQWKYSKDPDSEYQLALGMYGADRPVIEAHRVWLRNNNLKHKTEMICPICSLHPIEEMDHFAPQSIFPEYSTHLNNLIPLCHRCNKTKDDDWLEDSGEQTYFNAFYDSMDNKNVIRIDISFRSGLDYNLNVELIGNDILQLEQPVYDRIKRTFERQKLKRRYETEIRSVLDKDISRLTADYSTHKDLHADIRAFQNHHQETWRRQLATDAFDIITDLVLYEYLQNRPDVTTILFDRICEEAQ